MTHREAIKMQEAIKAGLKETGKDHPYRDALIPLMKESCDMAIKALEGKDNVPDTNVGDIISRQMAVHEAKELYDMGDCYCDRASMIGMLNSLPSAQPEQPSEIQDILDYLDTVLHPIISPERWDVYSELHDMISGLSSAQTNCTDCIMHGGDWECDHVHYRKGHWIKRFYTKSSGESLEMHVCPKCRQEYSYDAETGESEYNFCPNCGSDNRGKQK